MGPKTSSPASVFEKVLRAFDTRGFTYTDVLVQLKRLLATGASPTELLEILRRRQLIEPLPEYAHAEILGLINDAIERAAAQNADPDSSQPSAVGVVVPDEEVAIDLDELDHFREEPIPPGGAAGHYSAAPGSPLVSIRSVVSEFVRPSSVDPPSAATARAAVLAADLAAARTALESEQNKSREIDKALAERIASTEAARSRSEEALRESERYQTESRALRDSLAARDAQLAALQQEHVKIVRVLDARAKTGTRLEADLLAARTHADATTLKLKASQDVAAVLNAQLERSEADLNAAGTELGAVKTQSRSYLELLRTREWRRGFDQNMFGELDARVDAADVGRGALQTERDHLQAQVARLQRKLETHDALVDKLRTAASADAQRVAELQAAAQLRESEQAAQIAEVESAQAARIAPLVADAEAPAPETTVSMEDSVAVGDVLMDRYRLVGLIGEGSMSRVYKATDSDSTTRPAPDSFIAVKVLTRPLNDDHGSFASFPEKAQRLRALVHPNIVRIFDCGRDGSTVFVTMEYFADPSLYTKLHSAAAAGPPRSGLDRVEARLIILAIADALDYAHRNDVVHGDLKPGNVIVINRGEIKVIDFEIASWVARPKTPFERREAAQQKTSRAITPHYASPQLMAGEKPEPADDVYALACLAYELMTGTHPYDPRAQSLKFPPPRRAELSSPQYSALVHGLQRNRGNRTPTVSQFVAEFTARERGGAWKPGAIARAMGVGAAMLVLALAAWFFVHHAPATTQVPSRSSVAAPNPGTVIRDCPTCPAMTVLPAGRFKQGSALADGGATAFEKPLHWVLIGRPLAMSTNVVTVDEFQEFIAATGRDMHGCDTYDGEWKYRPKNSWKSPGFIQTGTHPVTCASWNDAGAYARWLSMKTGHRYRLPSASEWEYAARAGGEAVQPWSPDGSGACAHANVADESAAHRYPGWRVFACNDGYVYPAPVGSFKANSFGLNDMLGNVFQWTEDCWHADYTGAPIDGSARTDGNCSEHELRGGSWFSTPAYVRANYRNHFGVDYRTSSVGIRLVRDIEQ